MKMPDNITVGQPFKIEKGGRTAWYKIIRHPFFDGGYAVVGNHPFLYAGLAAYDKKHIVDASRTIEGAWKKAYDHT